MTYRYATENRDYTDFSSGRVLYNLPGAPAFPVRLASEIFERALARLGRQRRLALYDPTCGGAYHLTALGFLYPESLETIIASDVDARVLELACRNLSLLSPAGLDRREQEISAMLEDYGKDSHAGALRSLANLRSRLASAAPVRTRCFQTNALDPAALSSALGDQRIDLVISDIPYGRLSGWVLPDDSPPGGPPPAWRLLESLRGVLVPTALVAVAADKGQKIEHPGYRRLERFQVGKRRVTLLQVESARAPAQD